MFDNIKINVLNDKFTKLSPFAFGNTFINIDSCEDETIEKTFKNAGISKGDIITDFDGWEYKIESIHAGNEFAKTKDTVIIDVKRIKE